MFTLCYKKHAVPRAVDICLIYTDENEIVVNVSHPEYAVFLHDLDAAGHTRFQETEAPNKAAFLGTFSTAEQKQNRTDFLEQSVWLLRFDKTELSAILEANPDLSLMPTRQLTRTIPSEDLTFRLYRGLQINLWLKRFKFCPTCGEQLILSEEEVALQCKKCDSSNYPVISPAMIVAITRNNGSEILLVQAKNRTGNWWGLVAGYSEAGESLEQTVEREVREETGLSIQSLRYVASQSWPFGHAMMLGFTAELAKGELLPDPSELDAAAWFPLDNLPQIPQPPSIGNRLISLVRSRYESGDR